MKKILVTGAAGFIGFSFIKSLPKNYNVIGIDNLNAYYDIKLKKDRLKIIKKLKNFRFFKIDLLDYSKLKKIFQKYDFDIVVNLAAQAGVRFSVDHPKEYLNSNLIGFYNILELSKDFKTNHFIYASSSSVYGDSIKFPSKEHHETSKPLSFYAATKKSNEVMAHSFSNIYKMKTTGLRFFTVYGPYSRPDMAPIVFTKNICENKAIRLFNGGELYRDFTYIDYVTSSMLAIINLKFPNKTKVPARIFNIGNGKPVNVRKFLNQIEKYLKIHAKILNKKIPKGDVLKTYSDNNLLINSIRNKPKNIDYKEGIKKFIDWYIHYYRIRN